MTRKDSITKARGLFRKIGVILNETQWNEGSNFKKAQGFLAPLSMNRNCFQNINFPEIYDFIVHGP
jgi:hypothetical protein